MSAPSMSAWVQPAIVVVGLLGLISLETVFPLRTPRARKSTRWSRNFFLALLSLSVLASLQAPAVAALARLEHGSGTEVRANLTGLRMAGFVLAFLFLDYTLWIWHRLNHRVPFLWRFHLVHHVDRDLDASTGLRFHFGEMMLSIGFRLMQVALIGGDLSVLGAWQSALFASIFFHHSNLRLPRRIDRWLCVLIVTPRMHGIHHSNVHAETDSNWSSLLTIWDRLHGTLKLDVPEERISIGVPAWEDEREVTLPRLLVMPFRDQRRDWEPIRAAAEDETGPRNPSLR